jgi:YgiT-type zinc finger domain-containing protein
MRCMICDRAEVVAGTTEVKLERGEFRLMIKNVPARICPACSEAFSDQDVSIRILKEAEKLAVLGLRIVERDYEYL